MSRSASDADDVMQDALIVAFEKQGEIPTDPWPWFCRVVVNCSRNNRRRNTRVGLMGASDVNVVSTRGAPPEGAVELEEVRANLLTTIQSLPREEQEAIALCILGGLSHTQASTATGIPSNTIKARVRRGLDRLRVRFANDTRWKEALFSSPAFVPLDGDLKAATSRWTTHARTASGHSAALSMLTRSLPHGRRTLLMAGSLFLGTLLLIAIPASAEMMSRRNVPIDTALVLPNDPGGGGESPVVAETTGLGSATSTHRLTEELNSSDFPDVLTEREDSLPGRSLGGPAIGSLIAFEAPYPTGERLSKGTQLVTERGNVNHGEFTYYYKSGALMEIGEYRSNKKTGLWKRYYDTGRSQTAGSLEAGALSAEGLYIDGHEDGTWTFYHRNGRKRSTGVFAKGRKSGRWTDFDESEQIVLIRHLKDGQLDGLHQTYVNGKLHIETNYRRGEKHGTETTYGLDATTSPDISYWKNGVRQDTPPTD